jgi:hypothetical protein
MRPFGGPCLLELGGNGVVVGGAAIAGLDVELLHERDWHADLLRREPDACSNDRGTLPTAPGIV